MHQGEHSAILSTFIKLLFVIKILKFVLSILSGHFTEVLLYLWKTALFKDKNILFENK